MKKLLVVLCAILCVLALAGCAKKTEPETDGKDTNSGEIANMGDAFAINTGYEMDESYLKIITEEYVYEANMTPGLYDKLNEIDFFAEDRDAKYAEILSVLPIEKKTLRSEFKLTDDQIAALIGKKGQEMIDMGFECYGYNLNEENAQFFMDRNGYFYNVTVEEHYDDTDDFFSYEAFSQSTIKQIVPND